VLVRELEACRLYLCGFRGCVLSFASLALLALHRREAHAEWRPDAGWVRDFNFAESGLRCLHELRLLCSHYNKGCTQSFSSIENLRAHVWSTHKDQTCPCPNQHSHTH